MLFLLSRDYTELKEELTRKEKRALKGSFDESKCHLRGAQRAFKTKSLF